MQAFFCLPAAKKIIKKPEPLPQQVAGKEGHIVGNLHIYFLYLYN